MKIIPPASKLFTPEKGGSIIYQESSPGGGGGSSPGWAPTNSLIQKKKLSLRFLMLKCILSGGVRV